MPYGDRGTRRDEELTTVGARSDAPRILVPFHRFQPVARPHMLFPRFLLMLGVPRAVVAAIAAAAVGRFGEHGLLPTAGALVVGQFWTFVATTGGSPYRRPQPESREEHRTETERKEAAEARTFRIFLSLLVLGSAAAILGMGLLATSQSGDWQGFALVTAITDGLLTILSLWWFNGYQSFVRAEAIRTVRRIHAQHEHLIGDEYPASVVESELLALGSDASPGQAWKAANEILRRITEAVKKVRDEWARAEDERRAAEEERRAKERAATVEPGYYTPPLPEAEPEPEPVKPREPVDPGPLPRAILERERARVKEEAARLDLPAEIVAAELERLDEEFRKRFGGSA